MPQRIFWLVKKNSDICHGKLSLDACAYMLIMGCGQWTVVSFAIGKMMDGWKLSCAIFLSPVLRSFLSEFFERFFICNKFTCTAGWEKWEVKMKQGSIIKSRIYELRGRTQKSTLTNRKKLFRIITAVVLWKSFYLKLYILKFIIQGNEWTLRNGGISTAL